MNITVFPSISLGPVKPVNGVGQPPFFGIGDFPMFRYLKEAGIPFSRLHDVGGMFGRNVFVDIPNVFRDFDADETDPANYDFAFTDLLLNALVENGVEPFYRLGVTIENYATIRRYRIDPPKDFAMWARICEHVIRHYTEGWADGFHHTITHWEIWNEPENFAEPELNQMWHGSFEEYCRLYEVASKHLKAAFPHLKIGGYGSCGVMWINAWKVERAMIFCGTGMGIHIAASKCPGVHAGVVESVPAAFRAITGNGVNVLAMGAFYVTPELGKQCADAYLYNDFGSGWKWWPDFDKFHQIAIDELNAFNYDEFKANGFKLKHLGEVPLELETKPE